MYLHEIHTKRNGKHYVTALIRESFRTPQGPRTRTICNVSTLPESVRAVLKETLKNNQPTPLVNPEKVTLDSALDYGGIAVLHSAWDRFGLDRILQKVASKKAQSRLKAMIFARLLFPSSKLALAELAQGTKLAAACGLDPDQNCLDEDDLYDAMDQLNGHWAGIEKDLYETTFKEGVQLVLYDLTSVYFEGNSPKKLGQYGYSRDHRADRKQVIVAVATDSEGTPIHVEVLRGNRADTTTLTGLLETLKRRFGIKTATFVFDGGMSSTLNLEKMEQQELRFVTRVSSSKLKSILTQLPQDAQPELWDRTNLIELTHEGKRYVIAGGAFRKERDSQRRTSRIEKGEKELLRLTALFAEQVEKKRRNRTKKQTKKKTSAQLQKRASQVGRALQRLKAHAYFDYQLSDDGQLKWTKNNRLIEQEEKIDGWYILHTNLKQEVADSTQVLAHYKNLLDVEEAFCQLKSYMEVRPVYHYRVDRVRNHIRLCFLAYWISARLGREWRALGESREVPTLLRQLQTIRVGTLHLTDPQTQTETSLGQRLTRIPTHLNALLKKLNLLSLFSNPPSW